MRRRAPLRRRLRNTGLISAALGVVVMTNAAPVGAVTSKAINDYRTSRPEYIAQYGDWQTIPLPEELTADHHGAAGPKINAIHAALLPTGKILVIAGSGNDRERFEAGSFRSLVWDPSTGVSTEIETPEDLFCAGHAFLPNGNLLVAGGTRAYEKLGAAVTSAAGGMMVRNESPDDTLALPAGTVFTSPAGVRYASTFDVVVLPAEKVDRGAGDVTITPSETKVWVEALDKGPDAVTDAVSQYEIEGLRGTRADNVYGMGNPMTLEKQDFQGLDASWEFDPYTESYQATGRLNESRWYPTLLDVGRGDILAVSGLDEFGKVLEGQNEVFSDETRTWTQRDDLERYFPTYPSLLRMADDRVFYSGSNAGYGPADKGRTPGIWDLKTNSFQEVPGLRDPDIMETSASVLLPPAQDQKVMVFGGGGVGESRKVTARTDIIDLDAPAADGVPRFTPGPDMANAVRYPNTVILPNDTVLATGGSSDYRGRGDSNVLAAEIYSPATGAFTEAAAPTVGRNYHSEALLLPDGRVITLGSDSLFGDAKDLTPGVFEQRIEIYSPPYLFTGSRPSVTSAPEEVVRGTTISVGTPDAARIATARLIRPSAVTHVTDPEQRSVALDITPGEGGALSLAVPAEEGLMPSGWYMLFLVDSAGVPSVARWVHVA